MRKDAIVAQQAATIEAREATIQEQAEEIARLKKEIALLTPSLQPETGKKNINTCSEAEIKALDQVGPVRCTSIIAGRPYNNPATFKKELMGLCQIGDVISDRVMAHFYAGEKPKHDGARCLDGSLDMRYKVNWGKEKNAD